MKINIWRWICWVHLYYHSAKWLKQLIKLTSYLTKWMTCYNFTKWLPFRKHDLNKFAWRTIYWQTQTTRPKTCSLIITHFPCRIGAKCKLSYNGIKNSSTGSANTWQFYAIYELLANAQLGQTWNIVDSIMRIMWELYENYCAFSMCADSNLIKWIRF